MINSRTYTVEEAKRALEKFCIYQERCHKEVREKLIKMRMIPDAIDLVVLHLLEHDFLNETRFAKTFTTGKFRIKKWGRKRIELELKKRDISSYNINEAFKEISDSDYLNTFYELAKKKAETITESNIWKKRKKLTDYLLYRGWESHLVYDAVAQLIKE